MAGHLRGPLIGSASSSGSVRFDSEAALPGPPEDLSAEKQILSTIGVRRSPFPKQIEIFLRSLVFHRDQIAAKSVNFLLDQLGLRGLVGAPRNPPSLIAKHIV